MLNTMNIRSRAGMRESLLVACCVLLAHGIYGQTVQTQPGARIYEANKANVEAAIARVKSGDFTGGDVDMIGRGGAVEAIPILKAQFVQVQDPLDKATIARVLVKLGDKDDTYWNFLVKLATPALESDAPDFLNSDPQAKTSAGPSPEFVAWAKAHNVPPNGPDGACCHPIIR